jgi:hypothetical protein
VATPKRRKVGREVGGLGTPVSPWAEKRE